MHFVEYAHSKKNENDYPHVFTSLLLCVHVRVYVTCHVSRVVLCRPCTHPAIGLLEQRHGAFRQKQYRETKILSYTLLYFRRFVASLVLCSCTKMGFPPTFKTKLFSTYHLVVLGFSPKSDLWFLDPSLL